MKRHVTFIVMLFCLTQSCWAACTGSSPTWTSTPDSASVQSCAESASSGDTVYISAGTGTWSSSVSVPAGKAVSIIGAGKDATIITNNIGTLITWSGTENQPFRLSGIRFNNQDDQTPIVALIGPIFKARIDHCVFNKGDAAIGTNFLGFPGNGPVYGVVDHSEFYNMVRPYFAMDIRVGDSSGGITPWTEGIYPGTDKMMYFEDNRFIWNGSMTNPNGQAALYGQYGGKAALRHNTFTGYCQYVDAHGDGPDEGTIYYEIYNNTFTEDRTLCIQGDITWQRGGQWIIHDNTFIGPSLPIRMSVYHTTDKIEHRVQNTYIWGNTQNGNPDQASLAVVTDSGQTPDGYSAANIKLDEQYFLHAPEPGQTYYPYVPYAYPHPLVTGGAISKCIIGDLNCDKKVDILDLVIVATNFGKVDFDLRADATKDNKIDIFDLVIVAQNFGRAG